MVTPIHPMFPSHYAAFCAPQEGTTRRDSTWPRLDPMPCSRVRKQEWQQSKPSKGFSKNPLGEELQCLLVIGTQFRQNSRSTHLHGLARSREKKANHMGHNRETYKGGSRARMPGDSMIHSMDHSPTKLRNVNRPKEWLQQSPESPIELEGRDSPCKCGTERNRVIIIPRGADTLHVRRHPWGNGPGFLIYKI